MITILSLESLQEASKQRPAHYMQRMLELGQLRDGGQVAFSPRAYLVAVKEFSPERYESVLEALSPYLPQPRDKWPLWVRAIALLKKSTDSGVGDTVARVVGDFGGDAFKSWHIATFGVSCSCDVRQESWNTLYSYLATS